MKSIFAAIITLAFYSCSTTENKDHPTTASNIDSLPPVISTSVSKATIIDPKYPLRLLFGTWTVDNNGPHADFVLDSTSFFIVDHDGDGRRTYSIHKDTFIVDQGDFKHTSIIESATKDSLRLRSEDGTITHYARWIDK